MHRGIFLIMGNAGCISSTVGFRVEEHFWSSGLSLSKETGTCRLIGILRELCMVLGLLFGVMHGVGMIGKKITFIDTV